MKKYKVRSGMKTLVCVLLALALAASSFQLGLLTVHADGAPLTLDIGVNPDSVTATLSENGALSISGAGEIRDFTGDAAPFAEYEITSVEIGAGITAIGDYTFYNCGKLQGLLTLPKGIVRIGSQAFSGETEAQAPKPDFVENLFVEALVTAAEEEPPEVTEEEPPKEQEASSAVTASAPEGAGETVASEEKKTENSGPADDGGAGGETGAATEAGGEAEPQNAAEAGTESGSEAPAQPEPERADPEPASPEQTGPEQAGQEQADLEQAGTAQESSEPAEQSGAEQSPAPQPTEAPAESDPSSAPEDAEQKETYTVKKITEQELGDQVFFPFGRKAGAFTCSEENHAFEAAMLAAGYEKADDVVAVTLNCGEGSSEGGDIVKNLPVVKGQLILPGLLSEFSAPAEEKLFSYEFGGWTEQKDQAGVVRQPGSSFPVGERTDIFLIANWVKLVKIKIGLSRVGDTATYSVPEIEGYDVLSYQWQTCDASGAWKPIAGETKQTYSRKLQRGDGGRLFRCVVTVKKQQNTLVSLFAAQPEEELSLAAVGSGLTELQESLAVKKGTGMQTVTKTISLPVSAGGGTSYQVTGVTLPSGPVFVQPADGGTLAGDGKTFAFEIAPTGAGWQTAEAAAQLVTVNPEGSEWSSGVANLMQTGAHPVTAALAEDASGTADVTVTLSYNGEYDALSGGTVELKFEEFSAGTAKNQVIASFTIEDISSVKQTASTAPGRDFRFPVGNNAAVSANGGVSAGFVTEYYPAQTGAANITFALCREDGAAVTFPSGTKLVLADQSGGTVNYYSYERIGGKSQLALSACRYPGPAAKDVRVVERLLFVIDFSQASSTLAAGNYYMTLSHPTQTGSVVELQKAAFTVHAADSGAALSAEKAAESTGSSWVVRLNATHNYPSGIWIQAALLNGAGEAVAFPEGVTVQGAENIAGGSSGSLQFAPLGGTVTFDFSKAAAGALAPGDYQLQLKMGPRPGLQNGGATSITATMAENLTFTYEEQAPEVKPAVRSLSVEAPDGRLLDVREADAGLALTIGYGNTQEGDQLKVEVLKKTGTEPGDENYGPESGVAGYAGAMTGTVTLTVPKGQEKGTYRALVSILDADGAVVAQEPFNFIVK